MLQFVVQLWVSFGTWWSEASTEVRVLVIGLVLKLLVDLIRVFATRIDGRWVHLLAAFLGFGAYVFDQMASLGISTGPYGAVFDQFFLSSLVALGVNEVTRGRGKLGPGNTRLAPKRTKAKKTSGKKPASSTDSNEPSLPSSPPSPPQ